MTSGDCVLQLFGRHTAKFADFREYTDCYYEITFEGYSHDAVFRPFDEACEIFLQSKTRGGPFVPGQNICSKANSLKLNLSRHYFLNILFFQLANVYLDASPQKDCDEFFNSFQIAQRILMEIPGWDEIITDPKSSQGLFPQYPLNSLDPKSVKLTESFIRGILESAFDFCSLPYEYLSDIVPRNHFRHDGASISSETQYEVYFQNFLTLQGITVKDQSISNLVKTLEINLLVRGFTRAWVPNDCSSSQKEIFEFWKNMLISEWENLCVIYEKWNDKKHVFLEFSKEERTLKNLKTQSMANLTIEQTKILDRIFTVKKLTPKQTGEDPKDDLFSSHHAANTALSRLREKIAPVMGDADLLLEFPTNSSKKKTEASNWTLNQMIEVKFV